MVNEITSVPIKKSTQVEQSPREGGRPMISQLRNEIERLFDDFDMFDWRFPFGRRNMMQMQSRSDNWDFVPAIDIAENGKAFKVTAELPGMDAKDIEIKLSNGSLVIKGEKELSKETKEDDYFVSERQYGSFCRTFALPEGVDRDKIEAEFSKGVLNVTLPKSAEAIKSEKTISVKAA